MERNVSRLRERSSDHQAIHEALAALKNGTPLAELPVRAGGDHLELAHEIVQEFNAELYRRKKAKDGDRALMEEDDILQHCLYQMIMDKLPQNVDFEDLERLTRGPSPENALVRWEEVKAAAQRDVESGWQSARSLTREWTDAWERAVFLAIRERLERDWPPRHPGEAMLLDELAQLEILRNRAMAESRKWSDNPAKMDQSSRSLDRVLRMYHTAVRTLLAIREQAAPRIVQRSNVLNIDLGSLTNGVSKTDRATICNQNNGKLTYRSRNRS